MLYNLKKGDKFRVLGDIKTAPASPTVKAGDVLEYRYVEGMYAKCNNHQSQGFYLVAYAEVEKITQ